MKAEQANAPVSRLFVGLFILLTASSSSAVWVYRPDGSLQCGMGKAQTLAETAAVLAALGGTVRRSEKRTLPFVIVQLCGAPTGAVNAHELSDADWDLIQTGFVGPAGFAEWTFDAGTAEVFKYDGTLQCGLGQKISLDEMEKDLTRGDIEVLSRREGSDGWMHIALCGASTGRINIFEVRAGDVEAAKKVGFARYAGTQATRAGRQIVGDDSFPWPW